MDVSEKTKAQEPYHCRSLPKALALPNYVERQRVEPTLVYVIMHPRLSRESRAHKGITYPRASTAATLLTQIWEFARFLKVKNKR